MRFGKFVAPPSPWPSASHAQTGSILYAVALQWLKEDRDYRHHLESSEKRKLRGQRPEQVSFSHHGFLPLLGICMDDDTSACLISKQTRRSRLYSLYVTPMLTVWLISHVQAIPSDSETFYRK